MIPHFFSAPWTWLPFRASFSRGHGASCDRRDPPLPPQRKAVVVPGGGMDEWKGQGPLYIVIVARAHAG